METCSNVYEVIEKVKDWSVKYKNVLEGTRSVHDIVKKIHQSGQWYEYANLIYGITQELLKGCMDWPPILSCARVQVPGRVGQ